MALGMPYQPVKHLQVLDFGRCGFGMRENSEDIQFYVTSIFFHVEVTGRLRCMLKQKGRFFVFLDFTLFKGITQKM